MQLRKTAMGHIWENLHAKFTYACLFITQYTSVFSIRKFWTIQVLLWGEVFGSYVLFSLQDYLTDYNWELSFTTAAAIINSYDGLSLALQVFLVFLVDAHLGNFMMIVVSSIAYCLGLILITISVLTVSNIFIIPKGLLLYTGMASIALGKAGYTVSLDLLIEEQRDNFKSDYGGKITMSQKSNGKAKHMFSKLRHLCKIRYVVTLLAFGFGSIDPPWSVYFGITALINVIATIVFCSSWRRYDKVPPQGSPMTNVYNVYIASTLKRFLSSSYDDTRHSRCLQKSANTMKDAKVEDQAQNKCGLSPTVGEVEEAKIVVHMILMSVTFVVWGILLSLGNTYFFEQADQLDDRIGSWEVPVSIFLVVQVLGEAVFGALAGTFLNKSKNSVVGLVAAMVLSILCCATSAMVEKRRLVVVDKDIHMSMFWLCFQFFLLGGVDAIYTKSIVLFYSNVASDTTARYAEHFAAGASGLGHFLGVGSVYAVREVTAQPSRQRSWFQATLNTSRLDKYYWMLVVLNAVNLVAFVLVAFCFIHRRIRKEDVEDSNIIVRHKNREHEEKEVDEEVKDVTTMKTKLLRRSETEKSTKTVIKSLRRRIKSTPTAAKSDNQG